MAVRNNDLFGLAQRPIRSSISRLELDQVRDTRWEFAR